MSTDQTDAMLGFRRAYGKVVPPDKITQESFEGNDHHLRRLVLLKPDERADLEDLWEYTQDLRYTPIQTSLLAYALPFCLEIWREDLRGISNGGGFVEHFYLALADKEVFSKHLTPKQTTAVSEFMRQTIFEEIDDQRGLSYRGARARPYRWVGALTSFGVLLPDVDKFWSAWWSLGTVGRAIAALQYISCLMYPENENPVFATWTPNEGGGPPCLWEFEGHLYTHRWLEQNVVFLKQILNVTEVTKLLGRSVDRLAGQPELAVAKLIQDDLLLLTDTLQARCAELPRLLETKDEPGKLRQWAV